MSVVDASLRKTRRVVKYSRQDGDLFDQMNNAKGLPVQWRAWLSHTRIDAPTTEVRTARAAAPAPHLYAGLQELQRDDMRVERLRINVARLKAQDEELRAIEAASNVASVAAPEPAPEPHVEPPSQPSNPAPYRTELPPAPDVQTETWTPRLARRR